MVETANFNPDMLFGKYVNANKLLTFINSLENESNNDLKTTIIDFVLNEISSDKPCIHQQIDMLFKQIAVLNRRLFAVETNNQNPASSSVVENQGFNRIRTNKEELIELVNVLFAQFCNEHSTPLEAASGVIEELRDDFYNNRLSKQLICDRLVSLNSRDQSVLQYLHKFRESGMLNVIRDERPGH